MQNIAERKALAAVRERVAHSGTPNNSACPRQPQVSKRADIESENGAQMHDRSADASEVTDAEGPSLGLIVLLGFVVLACVVIFLTSYRP